MWTCPACGRTFKRTKQSHYCGKAPETVDEYIALQPIPIQSYLKELRTVIQNSVPDGCERIAWSMPFYERAGNSVSFAVCQNHLSLYVGMEAIAHFKERLSPYKTKKSAIYFTYDKEWPMALIQDIITWCFITSVK